MSDSLNAFGDTRTAVYTGLLVAALDEAVLSADDADRLAGYRQRHGLTDAQHEAALLSIGWDAARFNTAVHQAEELDVYVQLMEVAVRDDGGLGRRVPEGEAARLDAYRRRHGVTGAMHAAALVRLGIDAAAYGAKHPVAPTPRGAFAGYVSLLRRALDDAQVTEEEELRLLEYRAAASISDEQHAHRT